VSDEQKPGKVVPLKQGRTHYPKRAGILARAREVLEADLPPDDELRLEAMKLLRYGMLNPDWHENARIGAARTILEALDGRKGEAGGGELTRDEWAELERLAAEKAKKAG
jgi:hypothetical protein